MLLYKDETQTSYTVYQDDIIDTQITVLNLTPGVYYDFYVKSRNLVGYSADSEIIRVLAAQIPDAPT